MENKEVTKTPSITNGVFILITGLLRRKLQPPIGYGINV